MNLVKNHYIRLFQSRADQSFLNSSFFLAYYQKYKVLAIFHKGIWTTYMPSAMKAKTLEAGVRLLKNQEKFNKYTHDFRKYQSDFKDKFARMMHRKKFTEQNVSFIIKNFSRLFEYYSKTEFFYLDKAVVLSKKNRTIRKNLRKMEATKKSGRKFLNILFMVENSYMDKLVEKLSQQFGIPKKQIYYYTMKEVIALFKNRKVTDEAIRGRAGDCVYIIRDKKEIILFGKKAETMRKQTTTHSFNKRYKIEGTAVYKGIYSGKVRVVPYDVSKIFRNFNQISATMDEGDVLVAETTSPELASMCKKAGAIVTNQGGLLSHAAIISRELKIPCIVGTGNATKFLHDGDLVEVDAERGIVRVLKK